MQADHSLFSVLPPGVRAALPKMWANDVLDHVVIVRVVGVSLSGQRSLVLRPKALNVGAEGPQCLGRRPSVLGPKALRGECSVVGLPRAPHPSHCTRVTITLLSNMIFLLNKIQK